MAEVTYYYDERVGGFWTDHAKLYDGSLETFAYTSVHGYTDRSNKTTCPGTDLGTITKVELRVYAYGDGDDTIVLRIELTPTYVVTPGTSPGWSSYVDVTADPIIGGWTWAKVADLSNVYELCDLVVEFAKSGKGNTMYCAKVEIRVTYTPVVAVPRHGFINFQDPAIV